MAATAELDIDAAAASAALKQASPKYVPREWMLVKAYSDAEGGDHAELHRLHELFKRPYDEQPEAEARYFARSPVWRGKAGQTKMS